MNEKQKKVISKSWKFIMDNFDANGEVLDYLIADLVMEHKDRERIVSFNPNTAHNRNCAFFAWLFKSPPATYHAFLSALDKSGCMHVADKFRKTVVGENDHIIDPDTNIDVPSEIKNTFTSEYSDAGHGCTRNKYPAKDSGSHSCSEKLKKLLGKSEVQLKAYRENEGILFTPSPAFIECQQKLHTNNQVTIVGCSGDGKTTIAKELLSQSDKQAVIIAAHKDWEKIDLTIDQNLIILFVNMLGKFVLDQNMKKYWGKQLDMIYDGVRSHKMQVIITCRETVLCESRAELEHFHLFQPQNRVHLSGPYCTSPLDTDTKRKIIHKYVQSAFETKICDKPKQEVPSPESLEKIAHKTCLGFPQCCYIFVSTPECLARGHTFFDQPTEFVSKEIKRMHESCDKVDKFNYCTLVCVVIFEELTSEHINSKTMQEVAAACSIDTTSLTSEIRLAAERLCTSYLVHTRDMGYTFRHNSLLEVVFTSFFKLGPQLLIDHCRFELIEHLITTKNSHQKSYLFCEIQGENQIEHLCARLAREIMAHNIAHVGRHRVLTDSDFANKLCCYIEKSPEKMAILQSTERHGWYGDGSILFWSALKSDKCFVKLLLPLMKSTISVNTMNDEMSTALIEVCGHGNYGIYKLLETEPGVTMDDDCLWRATINEDTRIVDSLLTVRHWSKELVTKALIRACEHGAYKVYKLLVTYNDNAVNDSCLKWAADNKNTSILDDLLTVQDWSTILVTKVLGEACEHGRYEMYKSLVTYDNNAINDRCLDWAVHSGDSRIVDDLLAVRSWSRELVTEALYTACWHGRYEAYKSLVACDIGAVEDRCLLRASSRGHKGIVNDLLTVRKWNTELVSEVLSEACEHGRYEMYKLLVTYDEKAVSDRCLELAVQSGDSRIVDDLLTVRKWNAELVNCVYSGTCEHGRNKAYKSSVACDVKAVDDQCLKLETECR